MTGDEIRDYVARTRARQGLPAKVEDPATLGRVAVLLRPDDLAEEAEAADA